ncbi:MAG TPA: hypothetical protein DD827_05685 [Gammaproteobacteria bacterium]|nr:hypothetical protein [Gammaproteobacteria bacterium]
MRSLKILFIALLALLLASCNEGGIVGTGDGDAELAGDSSAPASNDGTSSLDSNEDKRLPKTLSPPIPEAWLNNNSSEAQQPSTFILRNLLQARALRHLNIQLELLYLESAYDSILAFCATVLADASCELAANDLNVLYDAATAESERVLLQKIATHLGNPAPAPASDKIGVQIPLDNITFTRSSSGTLQNHLTASRVDNEGVPISINIDWSNRSNDHRISFQSNSETSSLQHLLGNQLTERVASISTTTQEILLLTIAKDKQVASSPPTEKNLFMQADLRRSTDIGYQHISWDGRSLIQGSFIRARSSTDPMLQLPTSLTRALLDPAGNITALEGCNDSLTGNSCADDSSLWHIAGQPNTPPTIQSSPLFIDDDQLQTWNPPRLSNDAFSASSNTESIVLTPLNQLPNDRNLLATGTRSIAATHFRQYLWGDTPTEFTRFLESLSNDTIEFTAP